MSSSQSLSYREPEAVESVSMMEQQLMQEEPVLMLFTSPFCHACATTRQMLNECTKKYESMKYLELTRGRVAGVEKAFGLQSTPAVVCIYRNKKIVVNRSCDRLSKREWIGLLEELYE